MSWLSKGNVVAQVFKQKEELQLFIESKKIKIIFNNNYFLQQLEYLIIMFEQ